MLQFDPSLSLNGGPRSPQKVPSPALAAGLVGYFSFTVACGVILGVLLDDRFHTQPWLMLIGLVLGLVVGGLGLYWSLRPFLD